MFGFGKDKDLDGEDIDPTDHPNFGEKSEFKLLTFIIMSALVALFILGFIQNTSTITQQNQNTNTTLTTLNQSAERTLYVIEANSNETDAKVNSLVNLTNENTINIENNTRNIDSLYDYIKNLVDTEMPKDNQFKRNITSLIKNVSGVVNTLEDRLKNNNSAKIIQNTEYLQEVLQIMKTCKDLDGKVAAICVSQGDGKGGVVINSNNR